MKDFGVDAGVEQVGEVLLGHLQRLLPPPSSDIGETDDADPVPPAAAPARAGS